MGFEPRLRKNWEIAKTDENYATIKPIDIDLSLADLSKLGQININDQKKDGDDNKNTNHYNLRSKRKT